MLTEYKLKLSSGPISLRFDKIVSVEPGGELVPFYHYKIIDSDNNNVGHINFRVGETRHVKMVAGHIGYEVAERYRGRSYSFYACQAIIPLVKMIYDKVIITVDPKNIPSIRIIEKLGAKFLSEIEVPPDDPAFAGGARKKRRYEWIL